MTTQTVTTQKDLDAALADPSITSIVIDSPRGVWLSIDSNGVSSATVYASDSATVYASDSATVYAWDSATVYASDSATVYASDSATVYATPYVVVHLHSAKARVSGGHIIDVADLDLSDPATWCEHHGVTVVDGIATVYKAVDNHWTTSRGIDYSPGSTPSAPDWRADGRRGGGLHFSPTPWLSQTYYPEATRYVSCGVSIETLMPILGAGAAKCKAPAVVRGCVEVDIDGREVVR